MTRVWLTEREWACCGDGFALGDDVDFGIESRAPATALAEMLGPMVAATVEAIESHHEHEFADRVRGRVTAVHAVTREVVERRTLRRPGHGAPPSAAMPVDGAEWPVIGSDLGNGVSMGSRPSRYVIEVVPVPDSAVLTPVRRVRVPERRDELGTADAARLEDPPAERRARSLTGWLVDVDER